MSVENIKPYNKYQGNGVANEFSIDFPYNNKNDVKVYLKNEGENQQTLAVDTDYSWINDKTIRLNTAPANGSILAIYRETPLASDYNFANQSRLFPEEVTKSDDVGILLIQEVDAKVERSLILDETSTATPEELVDELRGLVSTTAGYVDQASNYADTSKDWAIKMDGVVEGSDYSAKYNAGLAATSASNASISATAAANSASEAANSASEAATAAMNAKTDMPFLHPFWADHILAEQNFLRSDNFSWHDGADAYKEVYNHLVDDIDGKSLTSETISGVTIQYYLADDGHKVCPATEESNVLSLYNTVDIAWYYILDTVNQRFKLPRTKWGFTGLRDKAGNYVSESLPNITGTTVAFQCRDKNSDSGALWTTKNGTGSATNGGSNSDRYIRFDASRSSSAYQDNAPVQQRATQMYLYFNVGKPTQTATEQTAGLNSELFNGKADTDLGNITNIAKTNIVNLLAVSSNKINIDFPYTVEKTGMITCNVYTKNNLATEITVNGVQRFYGNIAGVRDGVYSIYVFPGDVVTGQGFNGRTFSPLKIYE